MYLAIALSSLAGFAIAFYIYETNRVHSRMLCFLGHDCNKVVNSSYGMIFLVRNEIWGMLAYGIMFFAGILAEVSTGPLQEIFGLILLFVITPAALLSLKLSYIQMAVLKSYCFWCMVVNLLNFVLFSVIIVL